jgi:hypothetical protein
MASPSRMRMFCLSLLISNVLISIVVGSAKESRESRPCRDNFDGDRGGHGYPTLRIVRSEADKGI